LVEPMHLTMAAPAKTLKILNVQWRTTLRYLHLVMHMVSSRHPSLSLALLAERMACSVPVPHSSPLWGGVELMPGRPGGVIALLSSLPAADGVSLARLARHEFTSKNKAGRPWRDGPVTEHRRGSDLPGGFPLCNSCMVMTVPRFPGKWGQQSGQQSDA